MFETHLNMVSVIPIRWKAFPGILPPRFIDRIRFRTSLPAKQEYGRKKTAEGETVLEI